MRKILTMCAMLTVMALGAFCRAEQKVGNVGDDAAKKEKILFVNGSPNRDGNTAALAKVLLKGKEYESLMLTDYRINFYGQTLEGDQFGEVYAKMLEADVVVMGSPVYWHNVCASVRTLIERFYGAVKPKTFSGKKFVLLYQGAAPTKMMLDDGEYTMSRFAGMYGFTYVGMATNEQQAEQLAKQL